MTTARAAREKVLAVWPYASAERGWDKVWRIRTWTEGREPIRILLGNGPTRAAAWQDAAKRLEGEGK